MYQSQKFFPLIVLFLGFFLCSTEALISWRRFKGGDSSKDTTDSRSSISEVAENADSASVERLEGWFIIHVLGTGTQCLEKQKRWGKSLRQDFGNTTEAYAFLDLYGTHECEEGDIGVGKGKVRAWVVAEAYQRGEECVGQVLAEIVVREKEFSFLPRIGLNLNAVADGEILAVCNDN